MNFCPNCGEKLDDNAKFCTRCGYIVNTGGSQQTNPSQQQGYSVHQEPPLNSQEPPKKEANKVLKIVASVVVFLVVFGIARAASQALVSHLLRDDSKTTSYESEETLAEKEQELIDDLEAIDEEYGTDVMGESDVRVSNPEYVSIFTERGIVEQSALASSGLTTGEYVLANPDGLVDKMEYGYENDTVKTIVETVYYPLSALGTNDKEAIDAAMQEEFIAAEALPFVTILYEIEGEYYKITITIEELDTPKNISAAVDAGILQVDSTVLYISYRQSQELLESSGYIQK